MAWKLARPQSNWKCLELLKKQSPREETKQYQRSAWGAKKTLGNPGLNLLRLPCWFHAQKASNGHQFKGRDDKILIQCGIKDVNCKIFSFEFFVNIFSQCKDFFAGIVIARCTIFFHVLLDDLSSTKSAFVKSRILFTSLVIRTFFP